MPLLDAARAHAEAKAAAWRLVHGRRPAAPSVGVRQTGPHRVEVEFADRLLVVYSVNGGITKAVVQELPAPEPPAPPPGDEAGAPASASEPPPAARKPSKGRAKKAG